MGWTAHRVGALVAVHVACREVQHVIRPCTLEIDRAWERCGRPLAGAPDWLTAASQHMQKAKICSCGHHGTDDLHDRVNLRRAHRWQRHPACSVMA